MSVSERMETEVVTLAETVTSVEAAAASAVRFLVVAYQDDGIISISGTMLPFQMSAERAEWWGP
jgi:hypothetical protein